MTGKNWNTLIAILDSQLKNGQTEDVRGALFEIKRVDVPKQHLHQLADLWRRMGHAQEALFLLHPLISEFREKGIRPTNQELAIYGACLMKADTYKEAFDILDKIDDKEFLEILRYKCTGYFHQWDYRSAIPLLRKYVKNSHGEYNQIVGEINLIAALLNDNQADEAMEILERLIPLTEKPNRKLLRGHIFELMAQGHILRNHIPQALSSLDQASTLISNENDVYSLFIHKWRAIAHLKLNPESAEWLKSLSDLRKKAIQLSHWESVRDIDLFLAIIKKDEKLLVHVIFGTPHPSYQIRVAIWCHWSYHLPAQYRWDLAPSPFTMEGKTAQPPKRTFCLKEARELNNSKVHLKVGQLLHRCLAIICSDFYKPFRMSYLFSQIYPDEMYHPIHSMNRAKQVIARLNRWFEENEIPVILEVKNGQAHIKPTGPYSFLLHNQTITNTDKFQLYLSRLKENIGTPYFSSAMASQILGLSIKLTRLFLQWALDNKHISKSGQGRGVRYRLLG